MGKEQFFRSDDLTTLLQRARSGDSEARDELARIGHPHAASDDFGVLILVQPKHARRAEHAKIVWLNAAPQDDESLLVADVVRGDEDGGGRWTQFPIPAGFPLDRVTYDGDSVFSLWAGSQRVTGTQRQMLAAMRDVTYGAFDGVDEEAIASAFGSIPTAVVADPPAPKTAAENPPVDDPVLGTLIFNAKVQRYEATIEPDGRLMTLSFDADATTIGELLMAGRRVVEGLTALDANVRRYAATQLLALKNDAWSDESGPELSADEFAGRLALESVHVHSDKGCTFWYDDDDLFWGHMVHVDLTRDGQGIRAGI